MKCCFKSHRGRFLFEESTHECQLDPPRPDFLKCMTFRSAVEMWNKNAVKKPTITVWPILDLNPVSPDPCHMSHSLSHTHTHRSQEHSAQLLLRCKWFVSTHHWPNAAPSPPLSSVCSFLTLSVNAPPQSPLSPLHFCLCALFLLWFVSLPSVHHSFHFSDSWFVFSLLPQPRGPDEWVILLHGTQPSLSVFNNGSFDSLLSVFHWMAESESWKPRSYHKEHVNCETTKPTSD